MTSYLKHMQSMGNSTAFARRVSYLTHNYRKYLQKLPLHNPAVLEIGPGHGELLSVLNRIDITDIDILDNDQDVLDYCKKSYLINNAIYSDTNNPVSKLTYTYDLIVLTQVLEHIPKSEHLNWIRGLYSSLNPGGNIIITVPNGANPLVGAERYGDLQHENIFTIFSFRELMTFANLSGSSYHIRGFEIPPINLLNIIRIILQKILHAVFIILMMINGAIYQTLMTPNITLVIKKEK